MKQITIFLIKQKMSFSLFSDKFLSIPCSIVVRDIWCKSFEYFLKYFYAHKKMRNLEVAIKYSVSCFRPWDLILWMQNEKKIRING